MKRRWDGSVAEYDCELLEFNGDRMVLHYVLPEGRQVDEVWLPQGTETYAFYWRNRPYNVYHWIHPDGTWLGDYLNVADEVRMTEATLEWRDLIVDFILYPSGAHKRLDVDELPEPLETFAGGYVAQTLKELEATIGELREEWASAAQELRQARS